LNALTRALAMLALAALLVGLLAATVIARSDHVDDAGFAAVFLIGVGFVWIATGLFAWHRRPANKAGALMTWTGFLWLVNAFVAANSPAVFRRSMRSVGSIFLFASCRAHMCRKSLRCASS